ncbi:unnamed protein product, partial [marine sediment metagenome]
PDSEGNVTLKVPKEFGSAVEIIVLPIVPSKERLDAPDYFQFVAEDGTEYKVPEWSNEDFNRVSTMTAYENDDTEGEDVFDV